MKLFICILVNKIVTIVCKIFGKKGSVLPASIVWDVFKGDKILNKVKFPKYVIAITGSSGKGSTTDLVYKILTKNGYDVCYNANGSNGVLAAMTLILNNCTLTGKFKHDVLLLECDERHLKLIFDENKMTHLVITNITRDQPSRNGNPDQVFEEIVSAIGKETKLFLNADDPKVNVLKYKLKLPTVTYGIDRTNDSYEKPNINCVDFAYCPFCNKKLIYEYYHYGHIGNYKCPTTDYFRGVLDYEVTNVDYTNHTITIHNNPVHLDKDALYAAYYTLAAYSLCSDIIGDESKVLNTINTLETDSKRGKTLMVNDRPVTMLESKNENNLSYYQSLKYITNQPGHKTVVLGFENVSRRYKYNDLSWLWDVDFELLNNPDINRIFIIGRFKYDILTRLEFANIPSNKIVLVDDIKEIKNLLLTSSVGNIYTMVCFDMTAELTKRLKG
ncbi:MAG: DUF1727 domain-containing protein [Bacilli bacterium]|nr:DUF1727 domain-containing protein [Bacilli bacterium]